MNEQIRRPSTRAFGKDITNLHVPIQKLQKPQQQKPHPSLQLKYIPNIKPLEQKSKLPTQAQTIPNDPINQYNHQILQHMLNLQTTYYPQQSLNITKNMRQVLIDWMIDVSVSFQLNEQTLHLALSYLNSFQSKSTLLKEEYQLAGITCLWIASKYEQIYPPRMSNYIDVTANTYSLGQLRRMQERILQHLEFNLNHITMLALLQATIGKRQSEMLMEIEKKSIAYAKYIMELIVIEGNFLQRHNPSKLVATIVLVCNSVFKTKLQTKKLHEMKLYEKQDIYECYKEVVELLRNGKSYGSGAIKRKYQADKYYKVGKLKIQLKNQEKTMIQ